MKFRTALTVAAATLGVAAPAASAHVRPHSYWRTYPVASSLCARVAAGHAPKRLAADVPQITAACTTLGNSYAQAVATYQTAIAPIAGQVKSTLEGVRAARESARQTGDCDRLPGRGHAGAGHAEGSCGRRCAPPSRRTSRASAPRDRPSGARIHALRGAGSLPGDTGTPVAPAAPVVPSTV